jgi:hypothetical protein
MAKLGRPFTYQSTDEKPVTVSVRIPREDYKRVERYIKMHPGMTLTEFFLDGARLRLDTPADPRDIILSDDNTVMQEVQEMIRASVQAEIGKLTDFLGRQSPEAPAEPAQTLSNDNNTVIQESTTPAAAQAQARRKGGRPTTVRPRILELLHAHPEGLSALQIKVTLGVEKPIGDTLAGMVRNQLLEKEGTGAQVKYFALGAPPAPPAASPAAPVPARRAARKAQRV